MVEIFQAERLAKAIVERRTKLDMSQSDLARVSGVSQSQIDRLEDAKLKRPGLDILLKLRVALRYSSVEAMLRGEGELAPPPVDRGDVESVIAQLHERIDTLAKNTRTVRLYDWGAAGDPREGDAEPVGYQQVPAEWESLMGSRGFALRVRGDSMAGYKEGITDGSIVFVNPDAGWNVGDAVVATVDGKGLVVKQVWRTDRGVEILRSCPAEGERCIVPGTQYRVVGKVQRWLSKHGQE